MQQRVIGHRTVGAIGFGGAPISLRAERPSDDDAVTVVRAALDVGVTFFDTADVYTPPGTGSGHSERIIARALAGSSDTDVMIGTKGGKYWDAGQHVQIDCRPARLRDACHASLRALGTDCIDLYQLHEVDPTVPLEESVGALVALREAGAIGHIGLCNVTVDELERARAVTTIVSVQNQFSPNVRGSDAVVERCAAAGIAFLPWGPLTGFVPTESEPVSGLTRRFRDVADARGISVPRLVLAWELATAPIMIPIPGSTRAVSIRDNAAAADIELSPTELAALDDPAVVPR